MTTFLDLTDDIMFLLFENYFIKEDGFNLVLAFPKLLVFYDRETQYDFFLGFSASEHVKRKIKKYAKSIKGYRLNLSDEPEMIQNFTPSSNKLIKLLNIKFFWDNLSIVNQLTTWTNLEHLRIDINVKCNTVNLTPINNLIKLKRLCLILECKVSGMVFSKLKKLEYFSCDFDHKIPDEPFLTLNSNKLKHILIYSSSGKSTVTANEVRHISTFSLKSLEITIVLSQRIVDAIATITSLKYLRIYDIEEEYLKSKEFDSLSNLTNIIKLNMHVSKCSIGQINKIISRMTNLQKLDIHLQNYGKKVTVPLVIRNTCLRKLDIVTTANIVIEGLENTLISRLNVANGIHPSFLNHVLPHLEKIYTTFVKEQNYDTFDLSNAPKLKTLFINYLYRENGIGFLRTISKDNEIEVGEISMTSKQTRQWIASVEKINKKIEVFESSDDSDNTIIKLNES